MPKPYRLTIYENGQLDRMQPFEARDLDTALAFAERQRFGREAELSDRGGLVRAYPADARTVADRGLRRLDEIAPWRRA